MKNITDKCVILLEAFTVQFKVRLPPQGFYKYYLFEWNSLMSMNIVMCQKQTLLSS